MPSLTKSTTGERVTAATASLPRVNLLPPEIGEQRRLRHAQYGMAGAVLGACVVVGLVYAAQAGKVSSARSDLAASQAKQTRLQTEQARYAPVSQTVAQVQGEETMLSQAMGSEIRWSHYLNDLSLSIPDNVWVTSVAASNAAAGGAAAPGAGAAGGILTAGIGSVVVQGKAFSHDDVASWLDSLAREKGYADPYFTQSQVDSATSGRQLVTFASTVAVTNDALSGRYTRQGS